MRDFEAYHAAGRTWNVSGDPYGRDIWRAERRVPGVDAGRDELLPFVGPPFSLPLWRVLGLLPYDAAARIWQAILVLAAAALAFGALALARGRLLAWDVAATTALSLAFGPLTSAFALGQVALLSAGATVATLLALRDRHARLAAGTAVLAALQPNIGVVLLARLSDRRAAFALGFAALLAVGGSLAAVGTAGVVRYIELLAAHSAAERDLAIQMTVGAVGYGFGLTETVAARLQLIVSVGVVGIVAACAFRRRDPVERVAIASAALPLALPFAHEHDLVLALFSAIVCLRRNRGIAWIAAAAGTVLVAVDWLGLAQRPTGLWQSLFLAFAVCAACVALAQPASIVQRAAPFAILVVVGAAGILATSHPLAVWPDALGAFHAPHGLDVPTLWNLEQLRSGIGARDPVWAALRALSLLGCAFLFIAACALERRQLSTERS